MPLAPADVCLRPAQSPHARRMEGILGRPREQSPPGLPDPRLDTRWPSQRGAKPCKGMPVNTEPTQPMTDTRSEGAATDFGVFWVYPDERLDWVGERGSLLGRGADADMRLTGDHVSRRHATLSRSTNGLLLQDEGSLNPPRVNGSRFGQCHVRDNDVIRIGDWVGVVVRAHREKVTQGSLFLEPVPGAWVGPRSMPVWDALRRVANTSLPVVLQGETGTGKEVLAQALHLLSGRRGALVPVNCSALPEALAESLLFGHVRGAFTGAVRDSEGVFASAHLGTLFLDELIELPQLQQPKVLRALEDGRIIPVGTTQERNVDVRVVAAAQRPLSEVVEAGQFRADLQARVSGLTINLLPLRERREEIFRLFRTALGDLAVDRYSAGFVERLCTHAFRLNVRELATAARRCGALFRAEQRLGTRHAEELLGASDSKPELSGSSETPAPSQLLHGQDELGKRRAAWFQRHAAQLDALRAELQVQRGNLSAACRTLGISRQQAQRLLQAAEQLQAAPAKRAQ